MPNRIIRESARTSLTLDAISAEAERLFWRLVVTADDHGRFHADPSLVLAACFPLRIQRLKPITVKQWLDELVKVGAIRVYPVDGRTYGYFPTWTRHQRRPQSRSKFPGPPEEHGAATVAAPRLHGDGSVMKPLLREVVSRESRMTVPAQSTEEPVAYRRRLLRILKGLSPEDAQAFFNTLGEGVADRCGWSHAEFQEHLRRYLGARAAINMKPAGT